MNLRGAVQLSTIAGVVWGGGGGGWGPGFRNDAVLFVRGKSG